MIKDRLSVAMVAACVLVSCHLYGIMGDTIFIPMFLPIAGIALTHYTSGTQETVDDDYLNPSGLRSVYFVVLGVLALGLFGVVGKNLSILSIVEDLSIVDAGLCVSLIAVGETLFFQGFIFSYLKTLVKFAPFAIVGSALIFMVYHNWRYGADPVTMGYVIFAGVLMAYICQVTGRMWPAYLVHIINNLIAVSGA